jgi:hypothetical protein
MTNKREIPVCTHCGSTEVLVDAFAEWDVQAQKWELSQAFEEGQAYCSACDGEASIRFIWTFGGRA